MAAAELLLSEHVVGELHAKFIKSDECVRVPLQWYSVSVATIRPLLVIGSRLPLVEVGAALPRLIDQGADRDLAHVLLGVHTLLEKLPQLLLGVRTLYLRCSFDKNVLSVRHPAAGDGDG